MMYRSRKDKALVDELRGVFERIAQECDSGNLRLVVEALAERFEIAEAAARDIPHAPFPTARARVA